MRKRYRRPRRSSRDEHWPSWPGGINTADPATLPVRLLRNRILRSVRRARRVASFSPENKHLSTENNRLCRHNDAAAPKDGHLAKADVASVPQTKRSSPKNPSSACSTQDRRRRIGPCVRFGTARHRIEVGRASALVEAGRGVYEHRSGAHIRHSILNNTFTDADKEMVDGISNASGITDFLKFLSADTACLCPDPDRWHANSMSIPPRQEVFRCRHGRRRTRTDTQECPRQG